MTSAQSSNSGSLDLTHLHCPTHSLYDTVFTEQMVMVELYTTAWGGERALYRVLWSLPAEAVPPADALL